MSDLLERVLAHEGFSRTPYPDPLSGGEPWTWGHGLTYITEEESRAIVASRLYKLRDNLIVKHPWLNQRDPELIDVLCEMAFQLGWGGLHKFQKMFAALKEGAYATAADEGLDSQWARQTPKRAKALMTIVRGLRSR